MIGRVAQGKSSGNAFGYLEASPRASDAPVNSFLNTTRMIRCRREQQMVCQQGTGYSDRAGCDSLHFCRRKGVPRFSA